MATTRLDRFMAKVTTGPGCWTWTGATTGGTRPYGQFWNGTRLVKAHRWAHEHASGPIAQGFEIDHLCKNTLCVRADHLEVVTRAENIRRSSAPGPLAVRTGLCKRGHAFTPDNTYLKGNGGRECRICAREAKRAYKARKRASR